MLLKSVVSSCLYIELLSRTFGTFGTVMSEAIAPTATPYVAGEHSAAFVTCPNDEVAKTLARSLVEKKLAACVNIVPGLTSIYEWEKKIQEDNEVMMVIKTRTGKIDEVAKFVRENHPYTVAEVISFPIQNGNAPYLKWISDTLPEKKKTQT